MKRIIILSLIFIVLVSCEKLINDSFKDSNFWTPMIHVEKGNKQATLYLRDPRPSANYVGPGPSNPDYFEVLISEDNVNFTLHSKVDISTYNINIQNLTNDKPYYFIVTSHKDIYDPDTSNRVMTVPSEEINFEPLFEHLNYSVERASASFGVNYISFISNNYVGSELLLYMSLNSGSVNIIEEDAHNAQWSYSDNKLVYISYILEDITEYPDKMKIYEVDEMETFTLLQIQYHDYYVWNPKFTPTGDQITYLSSENNEEKHIYDLWSIDPETKDKSKIIDFDDEGFIIHYGYTWDSSGEEIYMDGYYKSINSSCGIYKMNVKTKSIVPVVKSYWCDRIPTISPDNSKLLFVSYRTGKDELWCLSLEEQCLIQITGGNSYSFDSRYSNIQWLNNSEILITAYKDTKSIALKVILE